MNGSFIARITQFKISAYSHALRTSQRLGVRHHQHQGSARKVGSDALLDVAAEVKLGLDLRRGGRSRTMLAAASAGTGWPWSGTRLLSHGSVTAGLVGGRGRGRSSVAMAAATAWTAGRSGDPGEQAGLPGQVMVAEFEAVRLAMVQPALAANRSGLAIAR